MKKLLCLIITSALIFALCGCIKMKTLSCDGCGTEVSVRESSNMTDEWIIYCEECNEEFFGDNPLLSGKQAN